MSPAASTDDTICRARPVLGTFVEIAVAGSDAGRAHGAIDRAFAAIAEVERRMSFHDPASELSRINRASAPGRVRVSRATREVLAFARKLSRLTGGLFDVTVAEAMRRHHFLPGAADPERELGRWIDWRLVGDEVELDRPVGIDLGGIAKGWAVDRAVDALREAGVERGRVNAGGDLRVFGRARQPVYVRHPADPGRRVPIGTFRTIAVATSAAAGASRLPILRPRDGAPVCSNDSVTVLAGRCMTADALTKVLHLAPALAPRLLRCFDARAIVLAADPDSDGCRVVASSGGNAMRPRHPASERALGV